MEAVRPGRLDREASLGRDLAYAALTIVAPEELVLFDENVMDYDADPAGAVRPRTADEAVGFGVDLVLLTPYVLAAAGATVHFLVDSVGDAVRAETRDAVTERVRRLLRHGTAAGRPGVGVTPEIAREARRIAFAKAAACGLDESTAALIADAVAGELLIGT